MFKKVIDIHNTHITQKLLMGQKDNKVLILCSACGSKSSLILTPSGFHSTVPCSYLLSPLIYITVANTNHVFKILLEKFKGKK